MNRLEQSLRETHAMLGEVLDRLSDGISEAEWSALAHEARVLNNRAEQQAESIRIGLAS